MRPGCHLLSGCVLGEDLESRLTTAIRCNVISFSRSAALDVIAASQWYRGGFDGISFPLRRGKIQFPEWFISHTTSASRASCLS
jgi:hypothetical protein